MLNLKLYFKVIGARINKITEENKEHSIQLQGLAINNETNEYKKITLKINKEFSTDEVKQLQGKTVYLDSLTHKLGEYGDSFSKSYGADSFEIVKAQESGFILEKEITLNNVVSVVWKENKNDSKLSKTIIQAVVMDENMGMDLITVSIKIADEKVYKKLTSFMGKNILVKNLNEYKDTKNFKTYLSSEVMPTIIKE